MPGRHSKTTQQESLLIAGILAVPRYSAAFMYMLFPPEQQIDSIHHRFETPDGR